MSSLVWPELCGGGGGGVVEALCGFLAITHENHWITLLPNSVPQMTTKEGRNLADFTYQSAHWVDLSIASLWIQTDRCREKCCLDSHSDHRFGKDSSRSDLGLWWKGENEQMNKKINTKTIGNRKRDCAWGCARGINTTRENLQIAKHKSVRWSKRTPSWFVLCDLQIFLGGGGGFIPRAQPHAQSLFLFPIVFVINLIHFFDGKNNRATWQSRNKDCEIFGNRKWELIANFSATMMNI